MAPGRTPKTSPQRCSRPRGAAERDGRDQLERLAELKIRLLGDRVSRSVAWKLAARLDWDDTPAAEYLAVASLQADALITTDPRLMDAARGIVPIASLDDLQG